MDNKKKNLTTHLIAIVVEDTLYEVLGEDFGEAFEEPFGEKENQSIAHLYLLVTETLKDDRKKSLTSSCSDHPMKNSKLEQKATMFGRRFSRKCCQIGKIEGISEYLPRMN